MSENTISIASLRASLKGQVITQGDTGFDQTRLGFFGGVDRRPFAVVRVADAQDISHLISLAREHGMELAIRSGGHSSAGHSSTQGGLLLDLANLRGLHIDPDRRTALAETGLTAGAFTTAAGVHNLATGFGDTGSVGIGGLTLGGGVGYLVRKHGLTIDDLLAAEMVTADGQVLHVDASTHPDLFWAIRGGGGNFGVATRFHFRMHAVPQVLGGMLVQPATAEVIASFIAEAELAPNELSTIANVMTAPPMPFLPEEIHGKLIVMSMLVYAGEIDAGERVIAPFRSLARPYADMIKPMAYPEIYTPDQADYHPVAAGRTLFLDRIDRRVAEQLLDHLTTSTGTMAYAQLRVLGGAMARISAADTAFAHRRSRIMVNLGALYEKPQEKSLHETWVTDFATAIKQGDEGAYVNFIGDEGADRVRAAYPGPTWKKLAEIKNRYDPDNFFRLNHNIPPS